MADVKGKGKARLEPVDVSSDEDEDPLAMFTMKTTFKGLGETHFSINGTEDQGV